MTLSTASLKPMKMKNILMKASSLFLVLFLFIPALSSAQVNAKAEVTKDAPSVTTAPVPACNIPTQPGDIILDFSTAMGSDEYLLSNLGVEEAIGGPIRRSILPGEYSITLQSYDGHSEHGGQGQIRERWHLQFRDGAGGSANVGNWLASTNNIADLPDNQDHLIQEVNARFTVPPGAEKMTAYHGAYPDASSPNSIRPVCARLRPLQSVSSCPFTAGNGKIIVDFTTQNPNYVMAHQTEQVATVGPVNVNIPAGSYKVSLASFDEHSSHGGQGQMQEQWYARFKNTQGTQLARSGTIKDIPENVDTVSEVVNNTLAIPQGVTKVDAFHAAYPAPGRPESVYPVCMLLEPVQPPQEPEIQVIKIVRGGPNQVSDFKLYVGFTQVISGAWTRVAPGSYFVTEVNLPGYTMEYQGDCAFNGTVTVDYGDRKSCTIINTYTPQTPTATLTLEKRVINNHGGTKGPQDFPLFIESIGPVLTPFYKETRSGQTVSLPAGQYRVWETIPFSNYSVVAPGWTLDCRSGNNLRVGTITIGAGDNARCRITNQDVVQQCIPPVITAGTQATITGTVGQPITPFPIVIQGMTTDEVEVEVIGKLPKGIVFNPNTHRFVGTPTEPGVTTVTVKAYASDPTCADTITITFRFTQQCVAPVIVDGSTISKDAVIGQPFLYRLNINNSGHATSSIQVAITGSLPAGITFNQSTRTFSGTPTVPGTYTVSIAVNVIGQTGCSDTATLTITVRALNCIPPVIIGGPNISLSGMINQPISPYTIQVTTVVGAAPVVVVSGILPPGMVYSSTTRTISGTPTQAGTFNLSVVSYTDPTCPTSATITIIVNSVQCIAPQITAGDDIQINGRVGQPFSYVIGVTGQDPITVSISGQLPAGLTYNPSTRTISGTPTVAASSTPITITATNACGTDTAILRILIVPPGQCIPPTFVTPAPGGSSATGRLGEQFSYTIETNPSSGVDITVDSLPGGLQLNGNRIEGRPTVTGTFTIRVRAVSSSDNCQAEAILVITITSGGCTSNCGGGGFNPPSVFLSQRGIERPPTGSLSFVYLSQVPYTGLTSFSSLAFITFLLILSGGASYLALNVDARRQLMAAMKGYASSYVTVSLPKQTRIETLNNLVRTVTHDIAVETEPRIAFAESAIESKTVAEPSTPVMTQTQPMAAFSQPVVAAAASVVSFAQPQAQPQMQVAPQAAPLAPVLNVELEVEKALIRKAAESRAIISRDGLRLIAIAGDNSVKNATVVLEQLISTAEQIYGRGQDNILRIEGNQVKQLLFSTYVSMIPMFVGWITQAEDKKVLGFLRMLRAQDHDLKIFMKRVVYELDNIYRFRIEGTDNGITLDYELANNISFLPNRGLEQLIGILVNSVDDGYKSDYLSIKFSLIKAVEMMRQHVASGSIVLTK